MQKGFERDWDTNENEYMHFSVRVYWDPRLNYAICFCIINKKRYYSSKKFHNKLTNMLFFYENIYDVRFI